MQLNQNQEEFKGASQLMNSPDPDDFLVERYSCVLGKDKKQLELCKMYLYHLELKQQVRNISFKKIGNMQSQILYLKQHLKINSQAMTPKKVSKDYTKSLKLQSNSVSNQNTNRQKRIRRTANEINRHFNCPVETCRKEYGSDGSLNQHIRIKHQFLIRNYANWSFQPRNQQKSQQ